MSSRRRFALRALALLLLPAGAAEARERFEPVIVVAEPAEIQRRLQEDGVPYEGTFVAALDDARRARADLARFVRGELKRADRRQAARLRQTLSKQRAYVWHCGGFERSGGRYLHCSFVRYRDGDERLRQPRFPEIADGGTDVGQCNFSLTAGQIVTLRWNPEA